MHNRNAVYIIIRVETKNTAFIYNNKSYSTDV